MFKDFKGAAKRIDDIDLPKLAYTIGVGEDELHAVIDTETSGSGFDRAGRPKMLFEPHVFYRNLDGAERDEAVAEGLAYKAWGTLKYPADSYPRLEKAMQINETAALRSASWGLGQILGENHAAAGYGTPQEMVLAFLDDEEDHLAAMVDFIVTAGLDDDLRALAMLDRPTQPSDCVPFVRVYNGAGYARNNYHVKMATHHNRWRGIPDTPWLPEMELMPRKLRDTSLQQELKKLGLYQMRVDGIWGPKSEAALEEYRTAERRINDLLSVEVI